MSKTLCRVERSPLGRPRQKGELAESAISSGICRRRTRTTLIAVSGSGRADVDVQPEDQLAAGRVLHLLDDPAIARPVGENLILVASERMSAC